MRFLMIVVFLFGSLLPAAGRGLDGNWWQNLDTYGEVPAHLAKAAYVRGFYEGLLLGTPYWAGATLTKSSPTEIVEVLSEISDGIREQWPDSVAMRQLVDGIDTFYADHRNRLIPVHQSIEAVLDGILGVPEDSLERKVEFLRSLAAGSE